MRGRLERPAQNQGGDEQLLEAVATPESNYRGYDRFLDKEFYANPAEKIRREMAFDDVEVFSEIFYEEIMGEEC